MPIRPKTVEESRQHALKAGFALEHVETRRSGPYATIRCMACNTPKTLYMYHVRKFKTVCDKCREEGHRQDGLKFGLLLKRVHYERGTQEGEYECVECGGGHTAGLANIRRATRNPCRHCSAARFKAEASARGFAYRSHRYNPGTNQTVGHYECKKCGADYSAALGAMRIGAVACPECPSNGASKGEREIQETLEARKVPYRTQVKAEIEGSTRRFDFAVNGTFIEFDGAQHFDPSVRLGADDAGFFPRSLIDHQKNLYCIANLIPLIRIHYNVRNAGLLPQAVDLALTLEIDPEEPVYLTATKDGRIEVTPVADFLFNDGAASIRAARHPTPRNHPQ